MKKMCIYKTKFHALTAPMNLPLSVYIINPTLSLATKDQAYKML